MWTSRLHPENTRTSRSRPPSSDTLKTVKVFISSVIVGFEQYRDAAFRAARSLGHEVKRAEDFGASPDSPQQTCLGGVAWADVVVLILGARYGNPQKSGLAATHEEYRDARGKKPVLAFVEQGAQREPAQADFVKEVRDWTTGTFTADFRASEGLTDAVVRALHELELSRAVGQVDEAEMLTRAKALIPSDRGGVEGIVTVIVVGGPHQPVLRPAEIENPELSRALMQKALFGEVPVFDHASGTRPAVHADALLLEQDQRSVLLDPAGTVRVIQPARRARRDRSRLDLPVLIEEDVQEIIQAGLGFAGWVLDHVDPVRHLSDVVPVVSVHGGLAWRTRAEHKESPTSVSVRPTSETVVVNLLPPRRYRAALKQDAPALAKDLSVLLGRRMRA